MLRCMEQAQRPAAGVVTDEEALPICQKALSYRGEFFSPTAGEDAPRARRRRDVDDPMLHHDTMFLRGRGGRHHFGVDNAAGEPHRW